MVWFEKVLKGHRTTEFWNGLERSFKVTEPLGRDGAPTAVPAPELHLGEGFPPSQISFALKPFSHEFNGFHEPTFASSFFQQLNFKWNLPS